MLALVTGCAGFIGSHVTESLLEDGWSVIGVDCFNDNYARQEKLANLQRARSWDEFDFVPVDLARGALHDLTEQCDVIYHLAAEPGVRASWGGRFDLYMRNNLLATQHLLEAAKGRAAMRFVFASSSSVYGDAEQLPTSEDVLPRPFSPYGVTKLAAEHLCGLYHANYGVETVSLRYFSVFGPRQRPDMAFNRFARAALDGQELIVFGDGSQTRDFTFVTDVVDATRAAAERPVGDGAVFNVGGGASRSLVDAIAVLEECVGRKLKKRHEPRERGDVRNTGADITKARDELGFTPVVSFEDGIRAEVEWMMRTSTTPNPSR